MKLKYPCYKYCVYRYAPESFRAYRRTRAGGYEEISEVRYDSTLGYIAVTKGDQAVFAELKRRDRKKARKNCGISYGFFLADSVREYAFIRGLYTFDTGMRSRLLLYKEIKKQMEMRNWMHETSTTAQLGPCGEVMSVTNNQREIDRNRPCSIRVFP